MRKPGATGNYNIGTEDVEFPVVGGGGYFFIDYSSQVEWEDMLTSRYSQIVSVTLKWTLSH